MLDLEEGFRKLPDFTRRDDYRPGPPQKRVVSEAVKFFQRGDLRQPSPEKRSVLVLRRYEGFVLLQVADFDEEPLVISVVELFRLAGGDLGIERQFCHHRIALGFQRPEAGPDLEDLL